MDLYCHREDLLRKLILKDPITHDIIKLDYDDLNQKARLDSIFYGRVQKISPSFALIDIGLDRPGILNKPFHFNKGDGLFVQIKREALTDRGEHIKGFDKKGTQLTQTMALVTPFFMYLPYQKGFDTSSSLASEKINNTQAFQRLQKIAHIFHEHGQGKIIFRQKALMINDEILLTHLKKQAFLWSNLSKNTKIGLYYQGRSQLEKLMDTYSIQNVYTDTIDDFKDAKNATYSFKNSHQNSYDDEKARQASSKFKTTPHIHFIQNDVFREFNLYDTWSENIDSPWIPLPGGGFLLLERTSTLLSIDVNQGTALSLKQLNIEAAHHASHLIKKLNLGGNIIIDFAGNVTFNSKAELMTIVKSNLAHDMSLCAWSPLNWLEIRTQKTRLSVFERFNGN